MVQAIPAALAIGGSIIKGVGGYKAGQANARRARFQAGEELNAGNAQALRIRDQARDAIGQQIAGQFSNGFEGGTGTALDALTQSQIDQTLDMLEVRRQAAGKARGLQMEARQQSTAGKFALAEGLIGAASKGFGMNSDWAAARAPS